MQPARQVIREFRWREIFPAIMLLRVFRSSLRIHAMVLSLIAVTLISQGWKVCGSWCLPEEHPIRKELAAEDSVLSSPVISASKATEAMTNQVGTSQFLAPMIQEFERFAQPVRNFFAPARSGQERLFYALGFAWTLLVGALFAGIICRTAAFDLSSQERYGVFRALRFVILRWKSFLAAPLIPLLVLVAMLVPIVLLGAFAQYVSTLLAALLWGFTIIWGLALGMVALAVLFAWPLYWPALACEDADAFDSLGSSLGYVSQRPFSYALYGQITI